MTEKEYNNCVTMYADNVYRFILKNLRHEEDARDVVQTAFEKMWRNRSEVEYEKSKSYLKHDQHAYLGFMYVLPEYRGKGINKLILGHLKDWALSQGLTELRLEVYSENSSAIKAYEKFGFKSHMLEMRYNLDE